MTAEIKSILQKQSDALTTALKNVVAAFEALSAKIDKLVEEVENHD